MPPDTTGDDRTPQDLADTVVPRDAASLLLLRGQDTPGQEPEILMGLRGAGHRFMPNHIVFPGGAVDPHDHHGAMASQPPPDVLRRLQTGATASLAHAMVVAAARELEEETGLHLGHPPAFAGIDYLCRAITPPGGAIRFDARFLVIDAALAQGTLAGSGELENLRWFGLGEALALRLSFPTRKVLEQLALWLARSPVERSAATLTPTLRLREWFME